MAVQRWSLADDGSPRERKHDLAALLGGCAAIADYDPGIDRIKLIKVRKHASHCLEERLHSTIESAGERNICTTASVGFWPYSTRSSCDLEATMTLILAKRDTPKICV